MFWKHHTTNEQNITGKETSGLAENRLFPFYYKIPRFLRTLRASIVVYRAKPQGLSLGLHFATGEESNFPVAPKVLITK
jgi:hypothetical protein